MSTIPEVPSIRSLFALDALYLIRAADINYARARGGEEEPRDVADAPMFDRDLDSPRFPSESKGATRVASLRELLADRRIAVFAASVVLFHFANAAMLPLVGQKLTAGMTRGAARPMSACIVAVQLLDGVGAGIFGVVAVLVIADLTRGTGRFNLMQGALATATGLGGVFSNLLTGMVVRAAGFDTGFLTLAALAAAALAFFAAAMPETRSLPANVDEHLETPALSAIAGPHFLHDEEASVPWLIATRRSSSSYPGICT